MSYVHEKKYKASTKRPILFVLPHISILKVENEKAILTDKTNVL